MKFLYLSSSVFVFICLCISFGSSYENNFGKCSSEEKSFELISSKIRNPLNPEFSPKLQIPPEEIRDEQKNCNPGGKHRPLLHFSPAKFWMNDPNGLVMGKSKIYLVNSNQEFQTSVNPKEKNQLI